MVSKKEHNAAVLAKRLICKACVCDGLYNKMTVSDSYDNSVNCENVRSGENLTDLGEFKKVIV